MRRRNWRLLLTLIAAMTLLASACGGEEAATGTGGVEDGGDAGGGETAEGDAAGGGELPSFDEGTVMAEVQSEGVLEVGTKYDQPLFGLANLEGVPEGFDVEIAKIIAEGIFGEGNVEVGGNLQFQEAVSANREPFLQDGTVDMVVATYTINEERDEVVDFAGPYYVAGQDIMVPAGNPLDIQGVEDLNGLRVCTAVGSTSLVNVQEQAPEADVSTLFDTYSQCADALRQGRVDAVTTDNVILSGLIFENEGEFELVGNPFTEEPYGIGIPEGATEFCEFITAELQEAYDSGAWAEAFESTVGAVQEETPEPPELSEC